MPRLPLIKVSDEDKLATLQRLDQYRRWRSLEDKRYCLCCGKVIAGTEIQLLGGTRPTGPLRLACPTAGCDSIPMDWVMPTAEVLATKSILPEGAVDAPSKNGAAVDEGPRSIRARWRKLARQARRSA